MERETVSKASVYFRHESWNHRYVKLYSNGSREYGTITGFDDKESATKSYWKYLEEYKSMLKLMNEKEINNQQEIYDEDEDNIEDLIDDNEELEEDYE